MRVNVFAGPKLSLSDQKPDVLRHCLLRVAPAATMLALAINLAHAQTGFEDDFDDKDKPWQEVAVQLPAPPASENLLPFYVSPTATHQFSIDAKSLTVGNDGVIRYSLVTTSSFGVKNVIYEGIRCASFEHKSYAFGRPDGSWSRSRNDSWERIQQHAANGHHAALAMDYFCQNLSVAGNANDMLKRIKSKQSLYRPHD